MNAITPNVPAIDASEAGAAMTVAELLSAITRLKAAIGPKAEISVYVNHRYDGNHVSITVWANGMAGPGRPEFINAPDWPDAFAAAHAWADKIRNERRETIVRRLAFAIIDLTDQNGTATEAALSAQGFSRDEIREFGEAACNRASNMANLRPYLVVLA